MKQELQEKADALLAKMTLEEKASLCMGKDFWHLNGIDRLDIPSIMLSDGPNGLRKQENGADHLGVNDSKPAVCYPCAAATASSFDRGLLRDLGGTLGEECQAEDIQILLGPGVNIKRSPLGGRNFEYFSEDPYLSGELAASYIEGLQEKGVGASIKHFVCNNQETWRHNVSANVSQRALREIYLPAFETSVKRGEPWTVMSSYNRVNGQYVQESYELLTTILREEWGFDGFVVSDWLAVDDRIQSLRAGQDLEMPANYSDNCRKIVEAVKSGQLDENVVDKAVSRLLQVIFKAWNSRREGATVSVEEHQERAYHFACESLVLLKNNGVLPLQKGIRLAVIGPYAKEPRYQGGGSSHVHPTRLCGAWEAIQNRADTQYAIGYSDSETDDEAALREEAVQAATRADVAVLFVGVPASLESEGWDKTDMALPDNQVRLITAVAASQPNTVVVLHNGSPLTMPWLSAVSSVVETYLGGQEIGRAVADVLFGDVNPSGRLAETFPLMLEHTPAYLNFPGQDDQTEYAEGVFVGYRYYATKRLPVLFPFGYGLSYTTFTYTDLRLSKTCLCNEDSLQVTCTVTNTGNRFGKEVVQLYIHPKTDGIMRPALELKGFEKISLSPGESADVSFFLEKRSFALWDERSNDWYVECGAYDIVIAKDSSTPVLTAEVVWDTPVRRGFVVTRNTEISQVIAHPATKDVMMKFMEASVQALGDKNGGGSVPSVETVLQVAAHMPLRTLTAYVSGIGDEQLNALIGVLNELVRV